LIKIKNVKNVKKRGKNKKKRKKTYFTFMISISYRPFCTQINSAWPSLCGWAQWAPAIEGV